MAEWMVDGRPSLDVSAFSYQRFEREDSPFGGALPVTEHAG